MAVRKIKGSWWVDFSWKNDRLRRCSPLNTKGGAEAYEAHLRQLVAQHGTIQDALETLKPKPESLIPTLKDFAPRWLADYVDVYNKPSERFAKRRILQHDLLPVFGAMRLDTISTADIDGFARTERARGLKAKTVNNSLTILRKCLATAADWGLISSLPRVRFLKTTPPETKIVEEENVLRILAACAPSPWRALVLTAWRTGLRINELIALEWNALDLQRATLVVRLGEWHGHVGTPKSNRLRSVPLTSDVVTALQDLPRSNARVFIHKGKSLTYSSARWAIKKACRVAGVPHASFHPLRHTFATELDARGAHPKTIQDLLGHSTLAMTMRYLHTVPEATRAAVNLLETRREHVLAASGQPDPISTHLDPCKPAAHRTHSPLYENENTALAAVLSRGGCEGIRTLDQCPSSSDPEPASSLC